MGLHKNRPKHCKNQCVFCLRMWKLLYCFAVLNWSIACGYHGDLLFFNFCFNKRRVEKKHVVCCCVVVEEFVIKEMSVIYVINHKANSKFKLEHFSEIIRHWLWLVIYRWRLILVIGAVASQSGLLLQLQVVPWYWDGSFLVIGSGPYHPSWLLMQVVTGYSHSCILILVADAVSGQSWCFVYCTCSSISVAVDVQHSTVWKKSLVLYA